MPLPIQIPPTCRKCPVYHSSWPQRACTQGAIIYLLSVNRLMGIIVFSRCISNTNVGFDGFREERAGGDTKSRLDQKNTNTIWLRIMEMCALRIRDRRRVGGGCRCPISGALKCGARGAVRLWKIIGSREEEGASESRRNYKLTGWIYYHSSRYLVPR